MKWEPIETAPKDGTVIWVIQPRNNWIGGYWQYECIWSVCCWYHGYGDGFPEPQPTHWMPLPEPPK